MVHSKINQREGISRGFPGEGLQKRNLYVSATPLEVPITGRGWWYSQPELFSPKAMNRKNIRSVSQGPSQY